MRRIILTLLLLTGSVLILGLSLSGRQAEELEEACREVFFRTPEEGVLGKAVTELEPKRIYQRYDPLLGGVTLVSTDGNGNLDPRPLGEGSVMECSFGKVQVNQGQSAMCKLEAGVFSPLPKGSKEARTRKVFRLTFQPVWWSQGPRNRFHWEVAQEVRFRRRNPGSVFPIDARTAREVASRKVIVPGKSVPRFYRTDKQYWKLVKGEVFAVPKGFWMQRFIDGNFHQVRIGHHLEPWPGEDEIAVEVKDTEEWIKIGKYEKAFLHIDLLKRSRVDWVRYYAPGAIRSTNRKVSAGWACRTCTGARKPRRKRGAVPALEEVPEL